MTLSMRITGMLLIFLVFNPITAKLSHNPLPGQHPNRHRHRHQHQNRHQQQHQHQQQPPPHNRDHHVGAHPPIALEEDDDMEIGLQHVFGRSTKDNGFQKDGGASGLDDGLTRDEDGNPYAYQPMHVQYGYTSVIATDVCQLLSEDLERWLDPLVTCKKRAKPLMVTNNRNCKECSNDPVACRTWALEVMRVAQEHLRIAGSVDMSWQNKTFQHNSRFRLGAHEPDREQAPWQSFYNFLGSSSMAAMMVFTLSRVRGVPNEDATDETNPTQVAAGLIHDDWESGTLTAVSGVLIFLGVFVQLGYKHYLSTHTDWNALELKAINGNFMSMIEPDFVFSTVFVSISIYLLRTALKIGNYVYAYRGKTLKTSWDLDLLIMQLTRIQAAISDLSGTLAILVLLVSWPLHNMMKTSDEWTKKLLSVLVEADHRYIKQQRSKMTYDDSEPINIYRTPEFLNNVNLVLDANRTGKQVGNMIKINQEMRDSLEDEAMYDLVELAIVAFCCRNERYAKKLEWGVDGLSAATTFMTTAAVTLQAGITDLSMSVQQEHNYDNRIKVLENRLGMSNINASVTSNMSNMSNTSVNSNVSNIETKTSAYHRAVLQHFFPN